LEAKKNRRSILKSTPPKISSGTGRNIPRNISIRNWKLNPWRGCRPCFQPGVIQYSKCGPVQRSNACGGFLAIQGGTNGGRMGEYHSDRQADSYIILFEYK